MIRCNSDRLAVVFLIMNREFLNLLQVCLTALFLSINTYGQGDTLVGHWEGAYVRLGAVQTVMMDFTFDATGIKGTYDIPDLSIYDEPIKDLSYNFPHLEMRPKHGLFKLVINTEYGEITGENTRWNPPVALHLKRKIKEPASFTAEDVIFRNGNVRLAGRLVKPTKEGRYPAVVVVHGSGAQGLGDNYYNFWGRFFAWRGVAALIYDKRGVGSSTGDFNTAAFDDLAGDALAAVKLLRSRKDVNREQIGLFGISQGGWIAPLAASRSNDIKFLILNVGPSVTVEEQELDRVEYTLRNNEVSETDIKEALKYTKQMFDAAYSGKGWTELDVFGKRLKEKEWSATLSIAESENDLAGWKRIRFDPAPILKQTKIPVLSLFGENDSLVPPKENRAKMEQYLKEAGNRDVTIRVIPKAGHDMESFGTLYRGEWKWPEKHWVWAKKSPLFYQTITEWLDERSIGAKSAAQ